MTLLKEPLNSFLRRALRYGKITSLFLLPILFFGSLVLWLASSRAESEMRKGLLTQARFIVDSLNGESLSSLSGSAKDLSSPLYRSLKRQLMDIRSVASECRFLYIMGRKQDGRLFYYADSEPQESKDYSPPGQIYPNAEFDLISTFRKGEEAILGPGSDAWGTWVSVLVPIRNLKTGKIIAFLGMDVDARLWKRTALFKGIVPTGGALILGIGLLALFLVHRGERSLRTPLFLRILPLLAILCFLVLTACALILWKVQDRRLDEITTGKVAERSMVWLLRQKESSPQALFKEKLIVAADQEFSPFTFLRGKALPAGHDIDVMNLLAKRMGIDVEYHLLPWQEAKRELLEKRADILLTLYYSDKRTEEYGMTTPVWQESFALFSNGSRRFQGFGDLRRGRLGTLQEGVVGPLFIQPLGLTKSTSFFPTFLDAFLALEKKRVDFVLAPYSVGIETLTKEKIKNVAVVGPPLLSSASCFAVRKEETSLLVLLNKHLEEMKNDGTLQRIHQRWNFHSRKELKDVSPWLRVVLLSLLAILLLSALLSIWVITLRREVKRTTGELQERQQYLSATLHSIIDGVISTDSSGRITDINGVAEALTGWRSGEALGHPLDEVFRCSTFTVSIEEKSPLFQMLHRGGFINHETPTVLLSKEGRERLITESRSSIHDTTGAPVGTVVVFRDVTEDYLQREELRESEERHRLVEENMPGAIAILNLEERQRFTYVSPNSAGLFGMEPERILALPGVDALLGEDLFSPDELERRGEISNIEARVRAGALDVFFLVTVKKVDIAGGTRLYACRDITAMRGLQAETMRAAHLASLGELAAGVAHEINSPISGIMLYADMLRDEAVDLGDSADAPDRILRQAERVAAIVRKLLTFARKPEDDVCPVDVRGLLDDSLELSSVGLLKDNVRLRLDLPDDLPPVAGREQEVQQVFVNLVSNARDALNEKYPGRNSDKLLEIFLEMVERGGRRFVRAEFLDHGVGIPQALRERVLMPFFSTKPKTQGTGLGLPTTLRILTDLGGRLDLDSREGGPTRAAAEFPVWEGPVED